MQLARTLTTSPYRDSRVKQPAARTPPYLPRAETVGWGGDATGPHAHHLSLQSQSGGATGRTHATLPSPRRDSRVGGRCNWPARSPPLPTVTVGWSNRPHARHLTFPAQRRSGGGRMQLARTLTTSPYRDSRVKQPAARTPPYLPRAETVGWGGDATGPHAHHLSLQRQSGEATGRTHATLPSPRRDGRVGGRCNWPARSPPLPTETVG